MSFLNPTLLDAADRRKEVAQLLAQGLLRHKARLRGQRERDCAKAAKTAPDSLDLQGFSSVHGVDENAKNKKQTHEWTANERTRE